jgi:hypothetical protein
LQQQLATLQQQQQQQQQQEASSSNSSDLAHAHSHSARSLAALQVTQQQQQQQGLLPCQASWTGLPPPSGSCHKLPAHWQQPKGETQHAHMCPYPGCCCSSDVCSAAASKARQQLKRAAREGVSRLGQLLL